MNWPLEGSREVDEGIIISEPMDWCKSPTAIVPYRLYAYQREAMNLADSVKQTSDRTHVKDSIVLKSYGDEPGVGGGVISGTHNAECTPKTWSQSVTAEGRNVVRHTDEWWMNHKNTWGLLHYINNNENYAASPMQNITPRLSQDAARFEANTNGSGQQFAQATIPFDFAPEEVPLIRPGPFGPGATPRVGPRPTLPNPGRQNSPDLDPKPQPLPGPRPGPGTDPGFRTSGCRSERICFDSGNYDLEEYQKQLNMQQEAINAKTACKNVSDIDSFDQKTPAQKAALRALANKAKGSFLTQYAQNHPGVSLTGKDALHNLDMVAGGSPTDFGDVGDSGVNRSIGPEWNAETRKGKLKEYAEEMCKKGCPMAVELSICSDLMA